MLKYIRRAYIMSLASYETSPGKGPRTVETNSTVETKVDKMIEGTKKISSLLRKIQKDGIDGKDKDDIKMLTEMLDVNGTTKEGLEETKKSLIGSFKESLGDGFTNKNKDDFSTFSSMLKTINPNFNLPTYDKIKSVVDEEEGSENGFSLTLKGDEIYIYGDINDITGSTDGVGVINSKGEIDIDEKFFDFDDNTYDNNEIDLEYAAKEAGKNEIRIANAQKMKESKKTIIAQNNPGGTEQTKPVELKDIDFINGKDKYLPTSATEKGIWTPITKEQVQKILNDGNYTSVKDFQKKNKLVDDGRIGGKTFIALHNKLEK